MHSSETKSRARGSPGGTRLGAGGQVTEPPTRPSVVLVVLAVGLVMVVLLLVLAHFTRSGHRGGVSEIAQGDASVDQRQSVESSPGSKDSAKGAVSLASRALVDRRGQMASVAPASPLSMADHWGIEITKVDVAAGGKALDLRYKVVDVAKATSMLYLTNIVYILDQSSGKVLVVPFQRESQTSQKLVAGKTYFTLLPNKEERVKSGSKVTVVLGGSRTENLVVN